MSRDFTPREMLAAEEFIVTNGGQNRWDFMEGLTFRMNNEAEYIKIYSEKEIANRKQFPYIGKLLDKKFNRIYEVLSMLNKLEVLFEADKEVENYIVNHVGDEESFVIKWFNGTLDPSFYYAEENHRLFAEHLLCKADGEEHK